MRTMRSGSRKHPLVAATLVAALLMSIAACSSSDGEDASGADVSASRDGAAMRDAIEDGAQGAVGAPDEGAGGDSGSSDGEGSGQQGPGGVANRPSVQTRAVIRTGEVVLVTKAMNEARGQIDALLGRHGGYLASEDTMNDRAGRPERSVLVMRVPEPAFDDVMSGLGDIGRTERADRSSEDVTTQVIDIDTRVATQEASLARLQRFMSRATDIDDMIRLESEIATRQAALESLKAQQKYLSDQTTLSTITVRMRTPAAPPPEVEEDETGFLVGLSDGWSALTTLLVGIATVAGTLLPFVVTLALVGVPLWLLTRVAVRRRRHPVLPPIAPDPT